MGLKTFTITQSILSTSKHCRLDQKYACFTNVDNWVVFDSGIQQVKLSEFIEELPIVKYKKGELDEDYLLINISDQEQRSGTLGNIEYINEIGSDKNYLGNADIIISKLGMPKGYIFLNSYKGNKILGSTEFIPYKIKDPKLKLLIKYLLLHHKMLKAYSFIESGKTPSHRRVNACEFLKIKIPLISQLKQDQIVAQIEPIEKKIKELKEQITPQQEVINKVFAREFGFDLEKFEELKKIKNYYIDLFAFGNNRDIRQSVKFHREAGIFVVQQLKKITNKKIKDFISEPIVLGKGVSPKNYDEDGDYFYISMANIKNWRFESEDSKLVSVEYSDQNKNKTVSKNDILIARSGEGTIGKVALIDDDDLQGIFADFTMRIRLQNYNHLFAYYYFRTEYFQYLVEVNKKGLGNNTNIFPSQIQEFPIIDISLKAQQKIVDEIKVELDKQEAIKNKIESERNKIDEIIEKAIQYN
jgi:restriction endonuclease S subunit